MNELVFIQNDEILVSSKDIAINFSKRHDNVLRDIENIKEKDVPDFEEMFKWMNYNYLILKTIK